MFGYFSFMRSSRVGKGNFTPSLSQTGREPLNSSGSSCSITNVEKSTDEPTASEEIKLGSPCI